VHPSLVTSLLADWLACYVASCVIGIPTAEVLATGAKGGFAERFSNVSIAKTKRRAVRRHGFKFQTKKALFLAANGFTELILAFIARNPPQSRRIDGTYRPCIYVQVGFFFRPQRIRGLPPSDYRQITPCSYI
jgi:hypothetical protein